MNHFSGRDWFVWTVGLLVFTEMHDNMTWDLSNTGSFRSNLQGLRSRCGGGSGSSEKSRLALVAMELDSEVAGTGVFHVLDAKY